MFNLRSIQTFMDGVMVVDKTKLWLLTNKVMVVGKQSYGCWQTKLWLLANKVMVVGKQSYGC